MDSWVYLHVLFNLVIILTKILANKEKFSKLLKENLLNLI